MQNSSSQLSIHPLRTKENGVNKNLDQVCYAKKQEHPFWFSSLGQMVQFGAIIICRTFKNYFGQFVWIEKKRKKEAL